MASEGATATDANVESGNVAINAAIAGDRGARVRAKVAASMVAVESLTPDAESDDDGLEGFIVVDASTFVAEPVAPHVTLEADARKEDAAMQSSLISPLRMLELALASSAVEEGQGPRDFEAQIGVTESEMEESQGDAEVVSASSPQTTGGNIGDSLTENFCRLEERVKSFLDHLVETSEVAERTTDRHVERFCGWGNEKLAEPWNARMGNPIAARQKRLEDFINRKSQRICAKSRAMVKGAAEQAELMQQSWDSSWKSAGQKVDNRINGGVSNVANQSKALARAARKGIEAAAKNGFAPMP